MTGGRGMTTIGSLACEWGTRTYIMGIINVTPDSFSGDGLNDRLDEVAGLAHSMRQAGADIIDIGGESTRPGHEPVSAAVELARVLPAIELLRARVDTPLSIDTSKAAVASEAVHAGAGMINDVWGGEHDPEIVDVAAAAGVPLVLCHNQATPEYHNFVPDVLRGLARRIDHALARGVHWDQLLIDPGIGFGKTWRQNLLLLRALPALATLGLPLLLGTSRKGTIARVLGDQAPTDRLEGTAATVALGIGAGVDMVRVHDVGPMARVCRMSDAIVRAR